MVVAVTMPLQNPPKCIIRRQLGRVSTFDQTTRRRNVIVNAHQTARSHGCGVSALDDGDRRHAHVFGVRAQPGTTASSENPGESRSGLRKSERMLRFRLQTAISAVDQGATGPIAVSIPAGTVLKVAAGFAKAAGFVKAEWDGKNVQVFSIDLLIRGESIMSISAKAGGR